VRTWGRVCVSVSILVLAWVAAWTLEARAQAPSTPRPIIIRDLIVEGNRRVQEAVILGRIQSKPGTPFNPSQLSEDVRAVFGLGFFDDVRTRVEDFEGGVKLTFHVVERPFVRDVEFAGNRRISADTLREKIDLKLGAVYNPVEVQRAREKLKEHYEEEGYFEVQITPETEAFPDGDVKVVFAIVEGRRITIDKIVIEGNKGLSDRTIKGVMQVQERQYFILRGTLQRQKLDDDVERILALYNDHGYVQARVDSTDIAVDRERARVTITIRLMEGPQYRIGKVEITGVTLVPQEEIRRQIKFKSGDVFSRSKVREALRGIGDLYSTIGRASAEVTPRTEQTPSPPRMDVIFEIVEGPEVYVERINVVGNVRSQDKILRREIPLAEGELFTLQKMQRARQRLLNLGFFETVNVTTAPGSDKTKIIVNVDVVERPTGLFSLGGGFSSVDSFLGTIDVSQRNFLGRGWELSARIRAGAKTQQGIISFTEPWFLDRPLAVGFDLYNTIRQYDEFELDSLGGTVRMSHPFADFWRWLVQYRITRDKVSDVDTSLPTELREEEGTRVTSLVALSLVRDSRDSVVAPTKGGSISLLGEFAGLGGDSRFVRTIANATYFHPIWFDHIVSGRVEAGYGFGWGDDELPLFERFYLGGPNTIRGFKFRKVSPKDQAGVRIGGDTELLGNAEYIIPLPLNIRVAGFFDVGNVYGFGVKFDPTDLRYAAGAGVRWLSPFGPIRIDYGVNLDRRTGEDFGAFHFSVGSPF
jgi:outer membrane protein insertion porin family